MASNRLTIVQGTSRTFEIDLVDDQGASIDMARLVGASAEFLVREQPTDVVNVLRFTTDDPAHLAFRKDRPALTLVFLPEDTTNVPVQSYLFQLKVTLVDASVLDVIEWSPFDVTLGGATAPTPPVFDNTVKVDHDWGLPDALRYMTSGGTPIANAQIRVYFKSDYDAGRLTTPVGVTQTNSYGRWVDPVLVAPGYSYTVQFFKPEEFGPDTAVITA